MYKLNRGRGGEVRCKRNSTRLPLRFYALLMSIRGHVVVKFYPSFKQYFPLFKTHYGHKIPYPKTKEITFKPRMKMNSNVDKKISWFRGKGRVN